MKPLKERIADREKRQEANKAELEASRAAIRFGQAQIHHDLARQGDEETAQREVALKDTRKRVAAQSASKEKAVNPFAKKVAADVAAAVAAKKKK